MKTKAIPCPMCGGRGYVLWTSATNQSCSTGRKACPHCNGTGIREIPLVMEKLRFGVEIMRGNTLPGEDGMRLYIKGEFDGKTYGTYVHMAIDRGVGFEVPVNVFAGAVSELQETMRQIEETLQKDGDNGCLEEKPNYYEWLQQPAEGE